MPVGSKRLNRSDVNVIVQKYNFTKNIEALIAASCLMKILHAVLYNFIHFSMAFSGFHQY